MSTNNLHIQNRTTPHAIFLPSPTWTSMPDMRWLRGGSAKADGIHLWHYDIRRKPGIREPRTAAKLHTGKEQEQHNVFSTGCKHATYSRASDYQSAVLARRD